MRPGTPWPHRLDYSPLPPVLMRGRLWSLWSSAMTSRQAGHHVFDWEAGDKARLTRSSLRLPLLWLKMCSIRECIRRRWRRAGLWPTWTR